MTDPFAVVRQHCLSMDGVTEKLSHSSPSFFAKGTPSTAGLQQHHRLETGLVMGSWKLGTGRSSVT